MTRYAIDSAASAVVVKARSSIHDTTTTWNAVSGTIDADPKTLVGDGAVASIAVDMTSFDAGDWLKNRKLKKDLDVAKHPHASFELVELSSVVREDDGSFRAEAKGTMSWRGRTVEIEAAGFGTVEAERIEARATFELDVTILGVKPPKVLMFKVDEVVSVEVVLVANAKPS